MKKLTLIAAFLLVAICIYAQGRRTGSSVGGGQVILNITTYDTAYAENGQLVIMETDSTFDYINFDCESGVDSIWNISDTLFVRSGSVFDTVILNQSSSSASALPDSTFINADTIFSVSTSGRIDTLAIPEDNHTIFNQTIRIGEGAMENSFPVQNPPYRMTVIGTNAARNMEHSEGTVVIGAEALENLSTTPVSEGVAVGYQAGKNISYAFGSSNFTLLGHMAGKEGDVRSSVVIGSNAKESGGMTQSVIIGDDAAFTVSGITNGGATNSWRNVIIGAGAGYNLAATNKSVIVGQRAGFNLSNPSTIVRSVLIGDEVGSNQNNITDQLWIDNSSTSTPLIQGKFANDQLVVNGGIRIANSDFASLDNNSLFFSANRYWQKTGTDSIGLFGIGVQDQTLTDPVRVFNLQDNTLNFGKFQFLHESLNGSKPQNHGAFRITQSAPGGGDWDFGDKLGSIHFYINDSSGVGRRNGASIVSRNETNATTLITSSANLEFYTSTWNNFEQKRMTIGNSGNVTMHKYGTGTVGLNSAVYWLGVNANGTLVEMDAPSTSTSFISNSLGSSAMQANDANLQFIFGSNLIARVQNNGTDDIWQQFEKIEASKDIEVVDSLAGVILRSPNGTRYRITVDNTGALSTVVVP